MILRLMKKMMGHWNISRRSLIQIPCCYGLWVLSYGFYVYQIRGDLYVLGIICLCFFVYAIVFLWICCLINKEDRGRYSKKRTKMFAFVDMKAFKIDVLHLATPIIVGIYNYIQYYDKKLDDVLLMIGIVIVYVLITFFVALSIFPYRYYKGISSIAEKQTSELLEAWFSVSDTGYKISSFSLLPYVAFVSDSIRAACPIVFSLDDIEKINEKQAVKIDYLSFNKCLFYFEENKTNENMINWIMTMKNFPHIKCVFLFENQMILEKYQLEINELGRYSSIEIIYLKKPVYDMFTLSEYIGKVNTAFNVRMMDMSKNVVSNSFLKQRYFEISKGPVEIRRILSKVFNELEPLAAIYALFDSMDLMIRLVLAFYVDKEERWYINNSRKVGNMFCMISLLEKKDAYFLGQRFPKEEQIYCTHDGKRKIYVHDV